MSTNTVYPLFSLETNPKDIHMLCLEMLFEKWWEDKNLMMNSSKIDPATLTAAGRSEYVPLDPKDKSKNRRIEVILTPNLDKLFEILDEGSSLESETGTK